MNLMAEMLVHLSLRVHVVSSFTRDMVSISEYVPFAQLTWLEIPPCTEDICSILH